MIETYEITIPGMVQGIGFRPFVAELAEDLGITGTVCNCGGIVTIVCEVRSTEVLEEFQRRLRFSHPQGAEVGEIRIAPIDRKTAEAMGFRADGFHIVESRGDLKGYTPKLPADISICEDCRKEMLDPSNRRHRYPFISCTLCGPRYSIIEKIPYDRDNITMKDFEMCPDCRNEYTRRGDRRRHAQTISCRKCGPQLIYTRMGVGGSVSLPEQGAEPELTEDRAITQCIEDLRTGKVLILKGIGGYQIACLASSEEASETIRKIKGREAKPFAVMFPDVESLREFAEVSEAEEKLLRSSATPIVLVRAREDGERLAPSVCGKSDHIGAFLPYTGLHIQLTAVCGPLVMTSCNRSAEPIITGDENALEFARECGASVAGVAWNKRRIVTPLDDSVTRVFENEPVFIRRSRGYVPEPVQLQTGAIFPGISGTALAMGGDLKSAFALASGERVYMSQYFGDLEEYSVTAALEKGIDRMTSLFALKPDRIIADLHPGYVSTRIASELAEKWQVPLRKVQHHRAHAASVMAEAGLRSYIGIAMDGTGYGDDGAVWGSEFFLCKEGSMDRVSHLSYTTLAGGDASSKNAKQNALCQMLSLGLEPEGFGNSAERSLLQAALSHGIGTSQNGSMGRLFDAVSAILGICDLNRYEGECAILLEQAANCALKKGLEPVPMAFHLSEQTEGVEAGSILWDRKPVLEACLAEGRTLRGTGSSNEGMGSAADPELRERLALGFHLALADGILRTCKMLRDRTGESKVALSGGCFANMLLCGRTVSALKNAGFEVFTTKKVPGNDSGLALGQVYAETLLRS